MAIDTMSTYTPEQIDSILLEQKTMHAETVKLAAEVAVMKNRDQQLSALFLTNTTKLGEVCARLGIHADLELKELMASLESRLALIKRSDSGGN